MGKDYEKSYRRMACGNVSTKREIEPPKHFCASCNKYSEGRCLYFNRPISGQYNKCFNHSKQLYGAQTFRIPANLDEIIAQEEKEKSEYAY